MLWLTCAFLTASMLLFARGALFGFISGAFWCLTLAAMARWLKGDKAVFAARFLGMQLALTSLQAFLVLVRISTATENHSDVLILQ